MATEVFSHSRLSSFEDCPRKFAFRYVEKAPVESESIEGFVGKRVHEVLERLYQFTDRGAVPSLAKVLDRFRALWDETFDPARVRIVREGMAPGDYRGNGERCLTNYYRRHYPFDQGETLGTEERVTFSLDGAGGYRVQGVIDRIVRAADEAIEIHDYKTGARVPTQEKLDQDRQLALYQMGVAQRYGDAAPIRLVWHYLLSDQLRTSTRTPDALDTLRRDTIALIDRIRAARTFEPRPSALCRWCEFFDLCPAGRERVGGPGLEPPHPAEELPAAVAVAAPLSQPGPALSAAVAAPAAAPTLPRANASGQLRLL